MIIVALQLQKAGGKIIKFDYPIIGKCLYTFYYTNFMECSVTGKNESELSLLAQRKTHGMLLNEKKKMYCRIMQIPVLSHFLKLYNKPHMCIHYILHLHKFVFVFYMFISIQEQYRIWNDINQAIIFGYLESYEKKKGWEIFLIVLFKYSNTNSFNSLWEKL